MEPRFVDREALRVMGVLVRCRPEAADFGDIWMNQFMSRHDEVAPLSTDGAYYGVDYMPDDQGLMEYVAGMAVGDVEAVREGLVLREVPAARYAVFECTVSTIGEAYGHIHGAWLPSSEEYELHDRKPGLEYYPPNTESNESPVFIYIPVRPKK